MAGATFPLTGCITGIPTVDDGVLEGDHEFSVLIDSVTPNDAVTFEPADTHVVTIMDNDGMLEFLYSVFLSVRYTQLWKWIFCMQVWLHSHYKHLPHLWMREILLCAVLLSLDFQQMGWDVI